jgi:tetratricopeptide (TPR) repeat protein
MAKFLDSPLNEQMTLLEEKAFKFYLDGNYEEYEKIFLEAWELLPEPKGEWKESYSIIRDLIENYFLMGEPHKAKKWSDLMFLCNPEKNSYGERELYAGMVAYELGDFIKAREFFNIVQKESGGRLWKREGVMKYFKFFKEKK